MKKNNNKNSMTTVTTTNIITFSPSSWIIILLMFLISSYDYERHNGRAMGFSVRSTTTITPPPTTTTRLPSNPIIRLRLSSEVIDSSSRILSSSFSSKSKSSKKAVNDDDNEDDKSNNNNNDSSKTITTIGTTAVVSPPPTPPIFIHKFLKPPQRVIPDDPTATPILYVYDHCPFCVRVRLALGLKNIKHTLVFLANDDGVTPTSMVGKKVAPILKIPVATVRTTNEEEEDDDGNNDDDDDDDDDDDEEDFIMMESMDIIEFFENDEQFGPTNILRPASGRTDLKKWQKSVQMLLRTLQRPRYVATGLLPEFQQLDSRHAFIANHPLPPYDKEEWKSMQEFLEKLAVYADAMANDPTSMIEELNAKLVALDDNVYCDTYCTEGGISLDDIDLWARLRSVSIIQDVIWPNKLRRYMDNMSELADISLYDGLAI